MSNFSLDFTEYKKIAHQQCQTLGVSLPNEQELSYGFKCHLAVMEAINAHPNQCLSFSQFVNLALYHPECGYYTSGKQVLGSGGDFITAPEISDIFSKALGAVIKPSLVNLDGHIIEFGAGNGTMAANLLMSQSEVIRKYTIIEISPSLREQQRLTLEQFGVLNTDLVEWQSDWPQSPVNALILGNELLDAIPAHRFRLAQDGFEEACVRLNGHEFESFWRPPISEELVDWLQLHRDKVDWQPEVIYEASPWRSGWLHSVSRSLKSGVILLIDYGYCAADFFNSARRTGTLQCFFRHHRHEHYLMLPGLQDITSHVNFSELCLAADQFDLTLEAFCTQADFILNAGVLQELEQIDDLTKRLKMSQGIQKLMLPGQMGEIVKAIAFSRNIGQNAAPNLPRQLNSRL